MVNYLGLIAEEIGISLFLLIIIIIWMEVWKLLALWKSARNNSPVWFIALALINTFGILEILYIFVLSKQFNIKAKPRAKKKRKK